MHYSVTEERRTDMPAGLPAVWTETETGLTLYLRADLPEDLADHFRRLCLDGPGAAYGKVAAG